MVTSVHLLSRMTKWDPKDLVGREATQGELCLGMCSRKATITLLPSPTPTLAEGYEDIGTKVMAVVGGQVKLYGMPGGASTPSWVRLNGNVAPLSTSITLDRPVFGWPVGAEVRPHVFSSRSSLVDCLCNLWCPSFDAGGRGALTCPHCLPWWNVCVICGVQL